LPISPYPCFGPPEAALWLGTNRRYLRFCSRGAAIVSPLFFIRRSHRHFLVCRAAVRRLQGDAQRIELAGAQLGVPRSADVEALTSLSTHRLALAVVVRGGSVRALGTSFLSRPLITHAAMCVRAQRRGHSCCYARAPSARSASSSPWLRAPSSLPTVATRARRPSRAPCCSPPISCLPHSLLSRRHPARPPPLPFLLLLRLTGNVVPCLHVASLPPPSPPSQPYVSPAPHQLRSFLQAASVSAGGAAARSAFSSAGAPALPPAAAGTGTQPPGGAAHPGTAGVGGGAGGAAGALVGSAGEELSEGRPIRAADELSTLIDEARLDVLCLAVSLARFVHAFFCAHPRARGAVMRVSLSLRWRC